MAGFGVVLPTMHMGCIWSRFQETKLCDRCSEEGLNRITASTIDPKLGDYASMFLSIGAQMLALPLPSNIHFKAGVCEKTFRL
jgi:hypothetical protein